MRIITKNYQKNEDFIFQESTATLQQDSQYKDLFIEFFICLLPSYIFLLTSILRCLIIKSSRMFAIPSQIPYLKSLQIIAYFMSLSYLLSFCMAFWYKDLTNIGPSDDWMKFLYLPASMAWYLSYNLTKFELTRKHSAIKLNQLLLYSASFCVYIYKLIMAETKEADQFAMFLMGMDMMRIFLSFLAIIVFCKFERSFQGNIKASEVDSSLNEKLLEGYPLQPIRRTYSTPTIRGVIRRENLHKITGEIEKKFQRELAPNLYENCFIIKICIGNNKPYKITKTLSQIVEIEKDLRSYYTLSRFPILSTLLPILDHQYLDKSLRENKISDKELIQIIQGYITDLFAMPEFMLESVVDFFEIPDPFRDDYIAFSEGLKSNQTSRTGSRRNTRFSTLYNNLMIDQEAAEALDLAKIQKIELEVKKIKYCQSEIKGEIIYMFEVKRLEEGKVVLSWMIGKSYNEFLLFNQKMEAQISAANLPNVLSYVPEMPERESEDCFYNADYWEMTLSKFEKYLKNLLSCKKAMCTTLLDFLGLDPLTFKKNSFSSEEDFFAQEQL